MPRDKKRDAMSGRKNGVDMNDQIHDNETNDIHEKSATLDNSNRKNSDEVHFQNYEAATFATNTLPRTGIRVYIVLFPSNFRIIFSHVEISQRSIHFLF